MRWLFAVFIASLIALLWAAIAVARHIRRDARERTSGGVLKESEPAREAIASTDVPED